MTCSPLAGQNAILPEQILHVKPKVTANRVLDTVFTEAQFDTQKKFITSLELGGG